jgi:tight adherence protein C
VTPIAGPLAAASAMVALTTALARREPSAAARLPAPEGTPFPRPGLIARIGSASFVRRTAGGERLQGAFARAAWPADAIDRILGACFLAACACVLAVAPLGLAVMAPALALALALLRAPSFVAARAGRRRLAAVERDVPLLLDVVALAAFAGLPAQSSLRRAVAVLEGPLADELSAVLVDVDLGARWRDRLGRLARELPAPDLSRAIALLVRTESIGAGFAEPIAILADEVRESRRQRATERARKAPVKMLFPLVFLVLPAFLLLTVVPVLVATLGSIR